MQEKRVFLRERIPANMRKKQSLSLGVEKMLLHCSEGFTVFAVFFAHHTSQRLHAT